MPTRGYVTSVVLLGLALSSCGTQTTSSTPPSVASSTPTSTASDDRSASAEPSPLQPSTSPSSIPTLTWSVESFGSEIHGLTTHGGKFVAVGRDRTGLAAWTSTDGLAWERHAVPDPTFIEGYLDDFGPELYDGTSMGPMATLGETLFSIGTFTGPIDFYRPVGWRSEDGTSWEFIESESEFYGYGAVTDVAAHEGSLLAAHATGLIGPVYSLWTWTNATSWQRSAVQSTDEAVLTVLHVGVGGDSVLAVGAKAQATEAPQDEWPDEPVAWRSTDARTWEAVALPQDIGLTCGVAPIADGGFVVSGQTKSGDLVAWTTSDEAQWTVAAVPSARQAGCTGLAAVGDWLVLTAPAEGGGGIWLSSDGTVWTRQRTPGADFASGHVAVLDGVVLVVGWNGSADNRDTIFLRGVAAD